MNSEEQQFIANICALPKTYREEHNFSMMDLLKRYKYPQFKDWLSTPSVKSFLQKHEDLLKFWELESEDTRSTENWYWTGPEDPRNNGRHKVAFFPAGEEHFFEDRFEACTFYILKWISGFDQFLK